MIINNLQLENFGSIKKADLSFQPGFNLIVGPNGYGKSFTMKALSYLLLNYTQKTIEDYCNWDSEGFLAQTEIEHQSKKFKVKTSFQRKNNKIEKELIIDNEKPFNTPSTVSSALKDYFEPTLCKAAILSFQNEVADLVNATDGARLELLKKINNFDYSVQVKKIEEYIEKLQLELVKVQNTILVIQNKQYDIKELLPLPNTEEEINNLQKEIIELDNKISFINNRLSLYDEQMKLYNEKLSNKNKLSTELTKHQSIIISNSKLILEMNNKDYKSYEVEISSLNEELLKDFNEELNKLLTLFNEIEIVDLETYDDSILLNYQNEKSNFENDLYSNKKSLEACKNGVCPVCQKEFSSNDISSYEEKIKDLNEKIVILNEKINQEIEKKNIIEKKNRNQELKQQEKISLQKQIEQEQKQILLKKVNIQNQINSKQDHLELIRKTDQDSKLMADKFIKEANESIKDINVRLKELEDELKIIPSKDDSLTTELTDLKNIKILHQQHIDKYNEVITTNQIYAKHNDDVLKQKIQDLKDLENTKSIEKDFLLKIDIQNKAKQIYKKDFPNYRIQLIKDKIEHGMNLFLEKAYRGKYRVELDATKTGLSIVYGPRGKDISLASGSETDLFNISLKLAFCEMSGLKTLILDELDKFMDLTISTEVYTILYDMVQAKVLDQIFIITHKEEIKELITNSFGASVFELQKSGDIIQLI